MRKYLFILAFLALFLTDVNVSAQTINKPETNEQLKTQIIDLEKEVEELQSVYELKSEMQDSLLSREKDITSGLYNFTMLFIAVVAFFVTIGGILLTYLINKLNSHQKKIDLVLDSKDFDTKVNAIEQRLDDIRWKERLNIISNAKRQFKTLCKDIDKIIMNVNYLKENHIDSDIMNEILNRKEWGYYTSFYQDQIEGFTNLKEKKITPEDDEEENYQNIEEELVYHIEELEGLLDDFEKIDKYINDILTGEVNLASV